MALGLFSMSNAFAENSISSKIYIKKSDQATHHYLYSSNVLRETQEVVSKGDASQIRGIYTRATPQIKVVDTQVVKSEFNLGKLTKNDIDYRQTYQHYKEAVERDRHNPEYLLKAGELAYNLALYDKAIGYFEASLALQLKKKGEGSSVVAFLWNKLGLAWERKGQYNKAIGYYEKALASDLKTFGPRHSRVAVDWNNLGLAWVYKGQYDKAIGYCEKALASDLKILGPEHPRVAIGWSNLGSAWKYKGQYDKAIGYYEKALASDLKILGP